MTETNDKNTASFSFIRNVSADKDAREEGRVFPVTLTVDGEVADSLERADNAIVSSALFSQFAIYSQNKIREQLKKNPDWKRVNIQSFADKLRPVLGAVRNVEKRLQKTVASLRKDAQHMTKEEREKLAKDLLAM